MTDQISEQLVWADTSQNFGNSLVQSTGNNKLQLKFNCNCVGASSAHGADYEEVNPENIGERAASSDPAKHVHIADLVDY